MQRRRESEFDEVDISRAEQRKVDDEAETVDIMTIEKIGAYSSDSENELFYLPTVPEPDAEVDAQFGEGGADPASQDNPTKASKKRKRKAR
jgi:hypothetical protein